jgi:hypothetical protein
MSIHFIPVGIEANSKKEAEEKVLKMQQIVTGYTGPGENKAVKPGQDTPIYKQLLGAAAKIGLVLLAAHYEREKEPAGEAIDWKRREYEWKLKRKRERKSKVEML